MNLISLSLWGANERYTLGALSNARLARVIYPGWTMRVYCGGDVPVLDELRALGADVRVMPDTGGSAGLFWRFLPAGERGVDRVIVRDADSRVNVRERAAVEAWIASGLPFHAMRDHAYHRHTPMLGGMWGCRGGSIPDIANRVAEVAVGARKHDDTKFLQDVVWPMAKDRCLVHSSVPEPLGGAPFPAHSPFDGFVGEIVDPREEAKDVIAVLLPSRGRPDAAVAAAESAIRTAADPDRLRLVVGVEPDEADVYRRSFGDRSSFVHVLRAGGNYVRAIRELQRSVIAGIYGLAADDFSFDTLGWDRRVRKTVAGLPERLGLVYGDDGFQGERLATAPFLTAEWIDCVENVLPGDYTHMFSDSEVTDIARQAGLLRYLPDVRITHHHPLAGRAAPDAMYTRASATMAEGRAEFTRREDHRRRLAGRLIDAARAPALSVLVHGLAAPGGSLDVLVAGLGDQIAALIDRPAVEMLIEADAGERPPREKRRSLLAEARGQWVMFLDGDDEVAADALVRALEVLAQDPDVVFAESTAWPQRGDSGAPPRVVAVRRAIALTAARRGAAGRDEAGWAVAISAIAKRQVLLDRDVRRRRAATTAIGRGHRARAMPIATAAEVADRRSEPWLPTPAQQLLLVAALGPDGAARRAWTEWAASVGVEGADGPSSALFPLVWRNVDRLGLAGPDVNALKPYYWSSWAACRTQLPIAAEIAGAFDRAGLPVVLIDDVAIATRYYARPELRPMGDAVFAVSGPAFEQASKVLTSAGWRAVRPSAAGVGAQAYQSESGGRLDLRRTSGRGGDDATVGVVTIELNGVAVRVRAPEDELIDVCVRASRGTPPCWVADVVAIVDTVADRLDWDRMAAQSLDSGVAEAVLHALDYVHRAFGRSPLERVCESLARKTLPATPGDVCA